MTDDLAQLITTVGLGALLTTALVFGFFPVFAVNLLARVYPPMHPRRRELVVELGEVPRRERVIWIFEVTAAVLFDGVPARWRFRRRRRLQKAGIEPKIWATYGGSQEQLLAMTQHFEEQGRSVTTGEDSVTVSIFPHEVDGVDWTALRRIVSPGRPRSRSWWIRLLGR